jgi:hypothetical protein
MNIKQCAISIKNTGFYIRNQRFLRHYLPPLSTDLQVWILKSSQKGIKGEKSGAELMLVETTDIFSYFAINPQWDNSI